MDLPEGDCHLRERIFRAREADAYVHKLMLGDCLQPLKRIQEAQREERESNSTDDLVVSQFESDPFRLAAEGHETGLKILQPGERFVTTIKFVTAQL